MSKLKFTNMDDVLHDINAKYVSLSEDKKTENKRILGEIVTTTIANLKKDPLFYCIYNRIFYGGSSYDGLRIRRPDEFDLDLLLNIEKIAKTEFNTCNMPGFIHLKLVEFREDAATKNPKAFKKFETFFDKKQYLTTDPIREWMEGIMEKSLNEFLRVGGNRILRTSKDGDFKVTCTKSGPAMTLHIWTCNGEDYYHDDGPERNKVMSIDLVPCFSFIGEKWPSNGFIPNPVSQKPEFFIVPKPLKDVNNPARARYWRFSFQEQERVLIDNKRNLKPTIKLLKLLRDNDNDNLKGVAISYFIKTVLLHVSKAKDEEFWSKPLSHVFMTVLKEFREFIGKGKIPYYWNKKYNLIGEAKGVTLENIGNRIDAMIRDIENNPDKPETVAKYLLKKTFVQDSPIPEEMVTTGVHGKYDRQTVNFIVIAVVVGCVLSNYSGNVKDFVQNMPLITQSVKMLSTFTGKQYCFPLVATALAYFGYAKKCLFVVNTVGVLTKKLKNINIMLNS